MAAREQEAPVDAPLGFLREVRKQAGRKLTDVAKSLGLAKAIVSNIELDKAKPSDQAAFLRSYARALDLAEDALIRRAVERCAPRVKQFIKTMRQSREPYALPLLPGVGDDECVGSRDRQTIIRQRQSKTDQLEKSIYRFAFREEQRYLDTCHQSIDLKELRQRITSKTTSEFAGSQRVTLAAIELLKAAINRTNPESREIYLTFKGVRADYHQQRSLGRVWWLLLFLAIRKGYIIHHLWSPADEPESTGSFVLDVLRCIRPSGAKFKECKGNNPYRTHLLTKAHGSSVSDLLIIPGVGALVMLAINNAEGIDGAIFLGPDQCHLLKDHFDLIQVDKTVRLLNVRSENQYRDWHDELVTAEMRTDSDRLLVAPFLTTLTVPKSFFRQGHAWYQFHKNRGKEADHPYWVSSELQRLKSIAESLKQHRYSFKQICTKEALWSYAKTGRIPHAPHLRNYFDTPENRIERINNTIHLLERLDAFEIAIADKSYQSIVGFEPDRIREPSVNWFVMAGNEVWLELWHETVPVLVDMHDKNLTAEFERLFEQIWDNLSEESRDKSTTISTLKDCLKQIPIASEAVASSAIAG